MAKLWSLSPRSTKSSSTSTLLLQSTHDSLRTCGTKRDRARTTGAHSFRLHKDSLFRDPMRKHNSEHRKKPSPSNPKVATPLPDSPRLRKTSISASSYRDPVNWKRMVGILGNGRAQRRLRSETNSIEQIWGRRWKEDARGLRRNRKKGQIFFLGKERKNEEFVFAMLRENNNIIISSWKVWRWITG